MPYLTIATLLSHFYLIGHFLMVNGVYNIKIIKYATGLQVRIYDEMQDLPDDDVLEPPEPDLPVCYSDDDVDVQDSDNSEIWYDSNLVFDEVVNDDVAIAHSLQSSYNRTKNMIYYIARSNVWDWFVTLTLSPEKIDRYDYDLCSKVVRNFFNNIRKRYSRDMIYLIVPEMHKDGAFHFHGLIGNAPELSFVDSGIKDNFGIPIYNLKNWRYGFSTASPVQDTARVASYICKYITKDFCAQSKGKRRYWASLNCHRAEIYTAQANAPEMEEWKDVIYEHMTWCKNVDGYVSVNYFELPLGDWFNLEKGEDI